MYSLKHDTVNYSAWCLVQLSSSIFIFLFHVSVTADAGNQLCDLPYTSLRIIIQCDIFHVFTSSHFKKSLGHKALYDKKGSYKRSTPTIFIPRLTKWGRGYWRRLGCPSVHSAVGPSVNISFTEHISGYTCPTLFKFYTQHL